MKTSFQTPGKKASLSSFTQAACGLSLCIAVLAVTSTSFGIFNPEIYGLLVTSGTISENLRLGSIAQDIVILPLSLILAICMLIFWKTGKQLLFVIALGIVWCEFYAFGLYTIQGQYTSIYPAYLAIFGLSIFTLMFGIMGLSINDTQENLLPGKLAGAIGIFLIGIILLMTPIWILRMLPGLQQHHAGETYGVFILDLGIVFPSIGIIAWRIFKKQKLSEALAGIALVKIFGLCFSWAAAEIFTSMVKETPIDTTMAATSIGFTLISLLFCIPYLHYMNKA